MLGLSLFFNDGFTKEEFDIWAKANQFFDGEDLADVEFWTNRIPDELHTLLDVKQRQPSASLEELLKQYKSERQYQLIAQQRKFHQEQLKTKVLEQQAIMAVVWMKLGLDTSLS
jgi:hypothetical protein